MQFYRKTMWKEVLLTIYVHLIRYIDSSIYKLDSLADAVAWEVAKESIQSIELEISRQKNPFFIAGYQSAAIVSFRRRMINAAEDDFKLRVSAFTEYATSYIQPAHSKVNRPVQSFDSAALSTSGFESLGAGGRLSLESACIDDEFSATCVEAVNEAEKGLDKLRDRSPYGPVYHAIALLYHEDVILDLIRILGEEYRKEFEVDQVVFAAGLNPDIENDRHTAYGLRSRTRKYWVKSVESELAKLYIEFCFDIPLVSKRKMKKAKFGDQRIGIWKVDQRQEPPLDEKYLVRDDYGRVKETIPQDPGRSVKNTLDPAEQEKILQAHLENLAVSRSRGFLGCYRQGRCPTKSSLCPCQSVKRSLGKRNARGIPKEDLLGHPDLLRRGVKPKVARAVNARPKGGRHAGAKQPTRSTG